MSTNFPIPETKVLAIASHVVYGYVGNTMATFVMQSLGCDVAAVNTVHFSNHTGYRHFKGRRHPAAELTDLYTGLTQSNLTDFSMLLTGYAPSAEAVSSIGGIASSLRSKSTSSSPGSFFWILDPVMGDQGRLYVAEDIVPMYKELLPDADLILPNQFEAELLSGRRITDLSDLRHAIERLHQHYHVPHVVVTSVTFPGNQRTANTIAVVGSTVASASRAARMFVVQVPKLNCYFSGTGDMFAALMVVRLREAAIDAGLLQTKAWLSPDEVDAVDLPLAKATEKVLASMGAVLEKTMAARDEEMAKFLAEEQRSENLGQHTGKGKVDENDDDDEEKRKQRRHLAESKAAEVRVVRNVEMLRNPIVRYKAQQVEL